MESKSSFADGHPLVMRLRQFSEISDDDARYLVDLCSDVRTVPAHRDLKSQGDDPETVHIVLNGLACRYKLLDDGRRQIMAFLVPGDPCDLTVFLLDNMDHSVGTICESTVATVSHEKMAAAIERPSLLRAFWMSTLVDESVLREWLVNLGRRDAYERIAHLLWELYVRHQAVGRVNGMKFDLPTTQVELADALGLTPVYVNKVLTRLRREGLIDIARDTITLLKPAELRMICGFDDDYLHLMRERSVKPGIAAK